MADPRTDFFASGADSSDQSQDARTAFFNSPETTESQESSKASYPLTAQQAAGGLARHAITGFGASAIAGVRSLYDLATGKPLSEIDKRNKEFIAAHTYQPPDVATAGLVNAFESNANPLNWPGKVLDAGGELINKATGGTVAGPVVSGVGQVALGAIPGIKGMGAPEASTWTRAPLNAQEVLDQAAARSNQSMGAAAAAPKVLATSPELQNAIVRSAQQTGGAINPEAVSRHIEADSLPVKIQLTPGQALQDPATISNEMNNRARTPGLPDLLNRQNRALTENVQALRDQVGPDVFTTNPVEHGDTLIQAYKEKDAPIRADISAKYQALKEANGGEFPVDGQQFVANADRALKSNMKRPFLPSGVESTLQEFRNGEPMTFEHFENLRTTLASEARKAERSGDGNAAAAVNLVREQLENLPMSDVAAPVKALADQARQAAKARFDALRADPAYNAAVNDTVAPDDFVRKFVIGGKRDDVATMRANLADNPTATQTMSVAALDHLRKAAGIDDMGNGTFSQAGYNKALQALGPKVSSLVDPKTSESLQTLGNVARYTQAQPKGAYVNNSNTLVAALGEHAMSAGENLLNAKTGIGGTLVRKAVENRALKKAAKETMTPYGGMTRLSDIPK